MNIKLQLGTFITIITLCVALTGAWYDLDSRVVDLEKKVKVLKKEKRLKAKRGR
jgi:hypothetical protein